MHLFESCWFTFWYTDWTTMYIVRSALVLFEDIGLILYRYIRLLVFSCSYAFILIEFLFPLIRVYVRKYILKVCGSRLGKRWFQAPLVIKRLKEIVNCFFLSSSRHSVVVAPETCTVYAPASRERVKQWFVYPNTSGMLPCLARKCLCPRVVNNKFGSRISSKVRWVLWEKRR